MTTDHTTEFKELIERASAAWDGITWDSAPQSVLKHLHDALRLAKDLADDAASDDESGPVRDEFQSHIKWSIRSALRRAVVAHDEGGRWWPDNGSHTSQQRDKEWKALAHEIEDLDDRNGPAAFEEVIQHAAALAEAESEHVTTCAKAAQEHGKEALECALRGDWEGASERAGMACSCEREFGGDPAWGPAHRFALEIYEADAWRLGLGILGAYV